MIKQFYSKIVQFSISQQVERFQVLLYMTNNSIKHQLFVYTQLNDQTLLFLTIQFSMSFVWAQFTFQTDLFDP